MHLHASLAQQVRFGDLSRGVLQQVQALVISAEALNRENLAFQNFRLACET